MSRPIIEIVSAQSDEIIRREMNDEEYAQALKDKAEAEVRQQAAVEAEAKRQALLDKLGITEEEARLLLGGN